MAERTWEESKEIMVEFSTLLSDFCQKYEELKRKHGLVRSGIYIPINYKERELPVLGMTFDMQEITGNDS